MLLAARACFVSSWLAAILLSAGCSVDPQFAGGAGGGNTASSGASGQCTTPDDCPGDENECAHRTCDGGVCGMAYAPEGTLVSAQNAGDCQKVVCDGAGKTTSMPDDSDVPSDGNACTLDKCTQGVASHPLAPAGTACGATGTLSCTDQGECAGCMADADCGASTACTTYACDLGTTKCVITYTPLGQGDPGGQQSGDCKKVVCNGAGGVATVDDDGDAPDDGNACTSDTCSSGNPAHAPTAANSPCGGSFKCDGNGSCLGCLVDSDCGTNGPCATYTCANGSCQATYVPNGQGDPGGQVAGDCKKKVCNGSGGVASVPDDGDIPNDGNSCTADSCSNGVPSNAPQVGIACGNNGKCDGSGQCVGCLSNADCGQSTACVSYTCQAGSCATEFVPNGQGDPGGQTAGDCKKKVCNGSGGTTTINDNGDVKSDGNACTTDSCSNGSNVYTPITVPDDGNPCTSDTCDPNQGVIHPPVANGTSCGTCKACSSGVCSAGAADGTLCGSCKSCSAGACYSDCGPGEICLGGDICEPSCGGKPC